MEKQGYDISPVREIIPDVRRLLEGFRKAGFPVFHTREGMAVHFSQYPHLPPSTPPSPPPNPTPLTPHTPLTTTPPGHPPTLTTLHPREHFRSLNNASALGINSRGPLGLFLIRGERGHDTIPELYPLEGESVIEKPGKGAFAHTEFESLLRGRGVRNLVFAGEF